MRNSVRFQNKQYSPSKVICIGRNYVEHIKELDNEVPTEPVIFLKPNSAISSHLYLHDTDSIHYEGEISLLIESDNFVAVGFGLDLTKRDLQSALKKKGLPWERAKAFDQSALFSQFVAITEPMSQLKMQLTINAKVVQTADYDLMLHKPESLLNEVKTFLSLEDGDILMTGTPKGVGKINPQDVLVGQIFSGKTLLVEHTWSVQSTIKV
ncbi:2-keto-4-pentenoate hydratase [Shewanella sp. Choline-02u-19]|uniref:fumarylacetoacetate hydrolase family protein n=1 Tax=unclassified Shewanella TaxID=196818 RepID=UPI000C31C93C|nr:MULTISPECIES: fumarylacetoacetate hydrolase family protein [unclassified Shewanella]PKH56039.1 2-keto-4-pentenoate hydratase [Shewanella sp. Bg11-22]PKI30628.1 2-keto-4-pentenoate hydratase [Shewanella sp. Choline-02u-19]